MYIVAIAWLYVVVLMAVLEPSWVGGVMTLVFYGLLPLAIILFIFGTPERRRRQARREAHEDSAHEDSAQANSAHDDSAQANSAHDDPAHKDSAQERTIEGRTGEPVSAHVSVAAGAAPPDSGSGFADHPVGEADGRHA